MAYYTGTVSSLAALRTAVINNCVAAGWTNAGNVIHKNGCYASFVVGNTNEESGAPANCRLIMLTGNGIDGSNNLTNTPVAGVRIGFLRSGSVYPEWDWPVTYHLHIMENPDECYLFVNYGAGQFFQQLAWGQSPAEGNAGSGNWMYGTLPRIGYPTNYRTANSCRISANGGVLDGYYNGNFTPAPFFWDNIKSDGGYTIYLNAQIHGAISDTGGSPMWSNDLYPLGTSPENGRVSSGSPLKPLMTLIPNAWNQGVTLLPCQIFQSRPDSKVSLIGELRHLRFTRNTYLAVGEVVSLGPDRWKVYPCYRKNADVPDPAGNVNHSGTIAMAIRYDGP